MPLSTSNILFLYCGQLLLFSLRISSNTKKKTNWWHKICIWLKQLLKQNSSVWMQMCRTRTENVLIWYSFINTIQITFWVYACRVCMLVRLLVMFIHSILSIYNIAFWLNFGWIYLNLIKKKTLVICIIIIFVCFLVVLIALSCCGLAEVHSFCANRA